MVSADKVAADTEEETEDRTVAGKSKFYSNKEDLLILGYISQRDRHMDVGGVELWRSLEERGTVPGRSWQGMKERFRKVIMKNIQLYDLTEETLRRMTVVKSRMVLRSSIKHYR